MPDTAYATVEEYKSYPNVVLPRNDTRIQDTLNAAARAIDVWTNRDTQNPNTEAFVAAVASAREFVGRGLPYLRIEDCVAVTAVEMKNPLEADTDYTALVAADYFTFRGSPRNPDRTGSPVTSLMIDRRGDYSLWTNGETGAGRKKFAMPTVRVTATWGYATVVPEQIKLATIAQTARWITRGRMGWQDTTVEPEFGMTMFRQALDPDIKAMLMRFQREMAG